MPAASCWPRIRVAWSPERRAGAAQALWAALDGQAVIQPADSMTLTTRDLDLAVSPPLPHGLEGTSMGYVVALTVTDHHEHQRFVFASDVQGPLSPVASAWLIQARPTTLYLSGPPSYIERELGAAAIERSVDHLCRIIDATGCRVIMDHHAVRDLRFTARFARLWETGRVVTAAAHLGLAVQPLEARREQLWAAVRKPPVKAVPARAVPSRAIMTRNTRSFARGGKSE